LRNIADAGPAGQGNRDDTFRNAPDSRYFRGVRSVRGFRKTFLVVLTNQGGPRDPPPSRGLREHPGAADRTSRERV